MSKKSQIEMYRQGDVLLVSASNAIDGEREPAASDGTIVLAHGEVTGHRHRFMDDGSIVASRAQRQLTLMRASALIHEEHTHIEVPPGRYDLPRQTEWSDDLEPRTVADWNASPKRR
jgi:hypothetical protein